jgi:hypothetical protein
VFPYSQDVITLDANIGLGRFLPAPVVNENVLDQHVGSITLGGREEASDKQRPKQTGFHVGREYTTSSEHLLENWEAVPDRLWS